MLPAEECREIRESVEKMPNEKLREKLREYPSIRAQLDDNKAVARKLALEGCTGVQIGSDESGLDRRADELIVKLVRNTITRSERAEFVTLQMIRVELMVPEFLRQRRFTG